MCAQRKEHLVAFRKNSAFLVRRARLLLGETQSDFANRFGVETSTVSRWERGLVKPRPRALAEITKMATKTGPFRSEDVIMASPVIKFLAPLNDLTTPLMVSKGFTEVLGELGYTFSDFLARHGKELWARPSERIYAISTGRCLRDIQNDPRWLRGEIAYVEFRGFGKAINAWMRGLAAPLLDPDKSDVALIEAVADRSQLDSDGQFVKLVPFTR
jgi:transcriptional regulator with XRE-family HTH domain